MSTPVFPYLAGASWPVGKKPTFSTVVAVHASGREVRTQLWQNPVWEFELTIPALNSSAAGQYGPIGAASLQTLLGFFGMMGGSFGAFVFYDQSDYQVTNQVFATGDGSTTSFQLIRSLGMMTESVIAPVAASTTLYFATGHVAAVAPAIYLGASLDASSNYSIASGLVTFNSPPGAGVVLSWTGYFGFLCRFAEDNLEFSELMSNLWEARSVKFKSLRAI